MLFVEKLFGKITHEFLQQLAAVDCERHCFPAGQTDKLQPVDRNVGQHLKALVYRQRDTWLEEREHASRWFGDEGFTPLSASELRILITRWVGHAWTEFLAELATEEHNLIYKTGLRTGCLLGPSGFLPEFQTGIGIPGVDQYSFSEADLPLESVSPEQIELSAAVEEATLPIEEDLQPSVLVDETSNTQNLWRSQLNFHPLQS